MKRILALLVGLTVLGGCAPAGPPPHELRIAIIIDPNSLSPLAAFQQDLIGLDLLWCQTLVGLDERNRLAPVLASRVPSRANGDISPDGLRITYRLRRGVRFADGVPFTSADVAFTLRAILDPANNAPDVDSYRRIVSLATPDPATVVVRLRTPWSAAVRVLFAQASFAYGILPQHAFAATKILGSAWEQHAFGTGPFRVASWMRGDRIVLEGNPYFTPRPKLARIVVRIVPDQTSAFSALRAHEVDVTNLNVDNVDEARDDGVVVVRTPMNGQEALYFQTAAGVTRDVRVRRAIAGAIDVTGLRSAWRSVYPAARSIIPAPIVDWPAAPVAPFAYDPASARRMLEDALGRAPVSLTIVVDTAVPIDDRIAVLVQAQLAKAGIPARIKAYTLTAFVADDGPMRNGRFDLLVSDFVGGSDLDDTIDLSCADAGRGGGNYSRYCSPQVERLMQAESTATTDAERDRDFDAIAAIARADVPLIPLYDEVDLKGVSPRVIGFRQNMLEFPVAPETWDTR